MGTGFLLTALEILLFLILAFLFGLFIGWLLWGRRGGGSGTGDTTDWAAKHRACSEELEATKRRLADCNSKLTATQTQMNNLQAHAPTAEAAAPSETELKALIPDAVEGEEDDLKKIKGIARILEGQLHDLGIVSFRQVALLDEATIRKIANHIGAFPDRMIRDDWMGQARHFFKEKYGTDL